MAAKLAQTVYVKQHPKAVSRADTDRFTYSVSKLKNIREPVVGSYLTSAQVDALLASGVAVEIRE